jgi:ATP-binding cassette subfamily C protein
MLLFLRLFGPINQLLFVTDDLQSALASLGRIVGVIRADETAVDAPHGDGVTLTAIEHVFTTDHPVLHKVSLRIAPGETVAVVGASGAGKTTLAAIAAGVHTPVRGEVRRPRSRALVTQDVHVFDTTLRENLLLARPGSTDAELHRALKDVGADALSARLPLGHDEPIGASGTPVTPAEAQQIALARVLLADPTFVVLDEATAEAGSSDADRLEEAADTVARGRTALVVAHRLSQASRADRIVLMEGGRITEEGTHDELRLAGGEYARLWAAWSRGR